MSTHEVYIRPEEAVKAWHVLHKHLIAQDEPDPDLARLARKLYKLDWAGTLVDQTATEAPSKNLR